MILSVGANVTQVLRPETAKPPVLGSQKQIAAPLSTPSAVNYGLPVRLKIPKLAIDAPVTYAGLTTTGNMVVPVDIANVGWYKHGTLPGNKGSAVLAGHINGVTGKAGVFANLHKLQKGDTLQVIDSNNSIISFTVRDIQKYGQDQQPSEVFNAADAAHLNLITCTGAWDSAKHGYLERLVVFTDKSD